MAGLYDPLTGKDKGDQEWYSRKALLARLLFAHFCFWKIFSAQIKARFDREPADLSLHSSEKLKFPRCWFPKLFRGSLIRWVPELVPSPCTIHASFHWILSLQYHTGYESLQCAVSIFMWLFFGNECWSDSHNFLGSTLRLLMFASLGKPPKKI